MKFYWVLVMLLLPLNVFAKSKDDLWNIWNTFFYKMQVDYGDDAYMNEALYNNEHKDYLKGLCTDVVDYMKQNNIDLIINPGDGADYLNSELDCAKLPCDTQSDFFDLMVQEYACIGKLPSVSTQEIDQGVKNIAANMCRTSSRNAFSVKVSGAGYNKYKVPEQTNCDLMGDGQMKCVRSGTMSKGTDTKTYASCCLFNLGEQGQVIGPIAGTGRLVYLFDETNLLRPSDFDESCKIKN